MYRHSLLFTLSFELRHTHTLPHYLSLSLSHSHLSTLSCSLYQIHTLFFSFFPSFFFFILSFFLSLFLSFFLSFFLSLLIYILTCLRLWLQKNASMTFRSVKCPHLCVLCRFARLIHRRKFPIEKLLKKEK